MRSVNPPPWMGLETLGFWDLSHDPLSIRPLFKKNIETGDLLVHNAVIKKMDELVSSFWSAKSPRLIVLSGERGSGKTSAFHYAMTKFSLDLRGTPLLVPVDMQLPGAGGLRVEVIQRSVYQFVFHAIKRVLAAQDSTTQWPLIKEIEPGMNKNTTSVAKIDSDFRNLIDQFFKKHKKVCFFLDNFDKMQSDTSRLVALYFSTSQSFFEVLLEKAEENNTILYIFLNVYQGMFRYAKRQIRYLDVPIVMKNAWPKQALKELLEKRLRTAYIGRRQFGIELFLADDALDSLIDYSHGSPSDIQPNLRHVMDQAFAKRPSSDNGLRVRKGSPVTKRFLQEVCVDFHHRISLGRVKDAIREKPERAMEICFAISYLAKHKRPSPHTSDDIWGYLLNRQIIREGQKIPSHFHLDDTTFKGIRPTLSEVTTVESAADALFKAVM